ncbi:AlbA family DNA-binding domain-containing protein [Streptomyces sp. 7N604]|uniref:AlbA family DNA-binding domain-containing protein n=1 Tax=Streptomyces sp. 7N604 TaxID=3457415 RepID=UPI003FD0E844
MLECWLGSGAPKARWQGGRARAAGTNGPRTSPPWPPCGGLLVFGVSDEAQLVGIDPTVIEQQLAHWVRNHVQPYLTDLYIDILSSSDGQTSVLLVDVPASEMAPHLVYGTASTDKEQRARSCHSGMSRPPAGCRAPARPRLPGALRPPTAGEEGLREILDFAADTALAESSPRRRG